jgi:hypothetical protein
MVTTRTATTIPAVRRIRFGATEVVIEEVVAGQRKPQGRFRETAHVLDKGCLDQAGERHERALVPGAHQVLT